MLLEELSIQGAFGDGAEAWTEHMGSRLLSTSAGTAAQCEQPELYCRQLISTELCCLRCVKQNDDVPPHQQSLLPRSTN